MRAQREQIRPELVVQVARDLLTLVILQRDYALGESSLVLRGCFQDGCKMVQFPADRGQLGRAAGTDACVIEACLDRGDRICERLYWLQRAVYDSHRDQQKRRSDR